MTAWAIVVGVLTTAYVGSISAAMWDRINRLQGEILYLEVRIDAAEPASRNERTEQ